MRQRCPALEADAKAVCSRYKQLFTKYAACSDIFSKSAAVTAEEIASLRALIKDFLALCRREVVSRGIGHITSKLHLLEEHVVPLMEVLGVGVGLLGEHGAESIHSTFNNYEKSFKNIPATDQRLKTVTDQHMLSCVMEINDVRPPP
eukprot:scpid71212/ scgid25393/ 